MHLVQIAHHHCSFTCTCIYLQIQICKIYHHTIYMKQSFPEDGWDKNILNHRPKTNITLGKHSESLLSPVLSKCQVTPELHN